MAADFMLTFDRMYESSKTLHEHNENYNSCYLAGYVMECCLKQIILKYATKPDGTAYSIEEIKRQFVHKINDLINCVNINPSIPAACRINCNVAFKVICVGIGGHPQWNPQYRYGEHPAWDDVNYSNHYMQEVSQLYNQVSAMRVGGLL